MLYSVEAAFNIRRCGQTSVLPALSIEMIVFEDTNKLCGIIKFFINIKSW